VLIVPLKDLRPEDRVLLLEFSSAGVFVVNSFR
jgi:hypothetical protein